ncbi:HAD family hydrolase [Methanobrevibacter sp.]|uniref:HAD family hydrolase n=1 Tax=Methanobrevibacter sp. TaxID=66852 RepID=UPI00388E1B41
MKKLYIFDFDGTLFDTVHDVVICLNEALSVNNFPTLSDSEYVERLGGNINEIVSLVLKDQNTPENIELIKKTYTPLYDDSPKDKSVPFDGIRQLLEKLQDSGALIAINSNRTTQSIKHFTDKFLKDIDFILIEGHNENYPSKPSPIGVNRIIDKADVSLDEAIYIGDSITDIKTAQNAGVDCVIVKWGYGFDDAYQHDYPLAVVDDVSQLYCLLKH